MADRLIGIDSGGTVTKVGLFDIDGNELASEGRANPVAIPRPGFTERDPDKMWLATCEAIRVLLERSGTRAQDIAAVTPSGFGAGAFFVDGTGNVVRPGIVSTDIRSADIVKRWNAEGRAGKAESAVHTRIFPGHTPAILAWLAKHEPATLEATAHVLWCKDFLRLRLTGDVSTDLTDATCPGMWNYEERAWASDALETLGLGAWVGRLPQIGSATEVSGRVTEDAAAVTGLAQGTPVARGAYDIIACSLASGVVRPDQLGIIGGTFSIASTLHARPLRDPLPNHQSVYPIGDACIASTASATSGSNLEWVLKTFLSAEKTQREAEGETLYEYVNALVEGSLRRPSSVTFLPHLFTGQPAGIIGANADDTLGDILRAVYEGVVCAHRNDVKRLLDGAEAASPDSIRLAGGVSKSDVWAQMFADAFGMTVEVANGREFGAKGAAMCGAVAVGVNADIDEAVTSMVRVERRFEPNPERRDDFIKIYNRYLRLNDVLASAV